MNDQMSPAQLSGVTKIPPNPQLLRPIPTTTSANAARWPVYSHPLRFAWWYITESLSTPVAGCRIFPAHAAYFPNTCVGNNLLSHTRAWHTPVHGQRRETGMPIGMVLQETEEEGICFLHLKAELHSKLPISFWGSLASRLLWGESCYILLK